MADMTTEWKGKPQLAVLKDESCGTCKNFRAGANPDARGECLNFVYLPERYPNQVCAYFEKAP